MPKTRFVRCSSLLNRDAVSREVIDGVEHITITSFTMPDDVVMNGVLYPALEIHNSFEGLNRTLAPIGHPVDGDGNFLSAADPAAIANFYAGAFNDKAERVGARIKIDKTINVAEAKKSDRGKRLLDRIKDLETNDEAEPIHTSTGIFLELETLENIQTNESGQEFGAIAHNLVFDHDAILLDDVGAAQPSDGVGMAVNRDGDKVETESINLDLTPFPDLGRFPDQGPQVDDTPVPRTGPSMFTLMEQLRDQGKEAVSNEWLIVADMLDGTVIYQTERGYFESAFFIDENDRAQLAGIPLRVERTLTYQPKSNSSKGQSTMRDRILNKLKESGVDTENLSDDEIFEAYNTLMDPARAESDDKEDPASSDAANDNEGIEIDAVIANAVEKAIAPMSQKIDTMESAFRANADEEKGNIVTALVNSGRYPDMKEDDLKALPIERLRELAISLGSGYGLPPVANSDGSDSNIINLAMPE